MQIGLFSRHRLFCRNASLDLLAHLNEGAQWAATICHYVAHQRTFNSFAFSQVLPVQSSEDDHRKAKERGQTAHKAALTQSLSILAEGVARNNPSDEAETAFVEAPKKPV